MCHCASSKSGSTASAPYPAWEYALKDHWTRQNKILAAFAWVDRRLLRVLMSVSTLFSSKNRLCWISELDSILFKLFKEVKIDILLNTHIFAQRQLELPSNSEYENYLLWFVQKARNLSYGRVTQMGSKKSPYCIFLLRRKRKPPLMNISSSPDFQKRKSSYHVYPGTSKERNIKSIKASQLSKTI